MFKKVLIVDDEKDFCELVKNFLETLCYQVIVAYNGDTAADLLEKIRFDFVLFDCNTPGLSGVELIDVLRSKAPDALRIMVSGYEGISERFAKHMGVDEYLEKPVTLAKLKEMLKKGDRNER